MARNQRLNTAHRTLDDIVIEGSVQFVNHVNRCLDELRNTKYESLVSELRKITQVFSYADTGVSEGVFKTDLASIGAGFWNSDWISGAGVLVHEAVHTKREFSGEFDFRDYANEERIACRIQAEFLRENGRSIEAVDLENTDGRLICPSIGVLCRNDRNIFGV